MKKKFEGIVRHLGHDVQAGQIEVREPLSGDLFSTLSTPQTPRTAISKVPKQDIIIVAGRNLGTGKCDSGLFTNLRKSGITAIIAESVSRGFYRGAINHGIAVIESSDAHDKFSNGEVISIDLESGEIQSQGIVTRTGAYPDMHFKIYLAGGLISYTKKLLGK
jgi:3-isopropylmalate dehydratase small subunit